MKQEILTYPIILAEKNDDSGHYYVVSSPNIQGLVTDGNTITEALFNAKDAMATILEGEDYPEPQDPTQWKLQKNEQTSWVTVNMTEWKNKYSKKVRKNITIPKTLSDWAKRNGINISKVTTEALEEMQRA